MGFIVLLPTVLTIYVLQILFKLLDQILGVFLSNILVAIYLIPEFPIHLRWLGVTLQDRIPGLGLIVTIFLLIVVGMATRSFIGKQVIRITEIFFYRIPIARSIYSTVQQIINAFTQDKSSFKQVVLVEYPRKGLYTIGFLTGESQGEIREKTSKELVNVFLPTTPNPTSGWLVLVPKEEVVLLEMTVEEGLKYIISGGAAAPKKIVVNDLAKTDAHAINKKEMTN